MRAGPRFRQCAAYAAPASPLSIDGADAARGAEMDQRPRPDLVGVLTLLGLILLGVACYWAVPWFMHVVKHQDCVGSGRMDC